MREARVVDEQVDRRDIGVGSRAATRSRSVGHGQVGGQHLDGTPAARRRGGGRSRRSRSRATSTRSRPSAARRAANAAPIPDGGAGDQGGGHAPDPTERPARAGTGSAVAALLGVRALALLERGGHLGEVGQQVLQPVGGGVERRRGQHPGLLGPEQLDVVAHRVARVGRAGG